jgi:hypothetical protein
MSWISESGLCTSFKKIKKLVGDEIRERSSQCETFLMVHFLNSKLFSGINYFMDKGCRGQMPLGATIKNHLDVSKSMESWTQFHFIKK